MAMVLAAIAARDSMNEKRVTENSVTLFRIWCRLQDSNPPPDDYKAPEESRRIKVLDENLFYKDVARAWLKRNAVKAPILLVEQEMRHRGIAGEVWGRMGARPVSVVQRRLVAPLRPRPPG
ncbi:TPA: hypothetical protein U2L33_003790 [Burkholderia cenocepacia]|nr:hypothetical protein [Burkholderia cenocepacia]